MKPKMMSRRGTVEFASDHEIKKKHVRGLLRKRAKQYDSDSDNETRMRQAGVAPSDPTTDDRIVKRVFKKQKPDVKVNPMMLKPQGTSSFQTAFKSIMRTGEAKFSED
jgi:hypothetical protein